MRDMRFHCRPGDTPEAAWIRALPRRQLERRTSSSQVPKGTSCNSESWMDFEKLTPRFPAWKHRVSARVFHDREKVRKPTPWPGNAGFRFRAAWSTSHRGVTVEAASSDAGRIADNDPILFRHEIIAKNIEKRKIQPKVLGAQETCSPSVLETSDSPWLLSPQTCFLFKGVR